ncbi:MAG TPA: methylated-DNA--[protein]-cysteine S-methyltransferase [Dehalococcoidia bacterium]|nr:methylated-DNA--[protein]-cysteine S-methyltransferase [Dehalococcoidia bacterium]
MIIDSPIGPLYIEATARGLRRLEFGVRGQTPVAEDCEYAVNAEIELGTARQLGEYFAGARTVFDLPLDLDVEGAGFRQRAWLALASIPYGATVTYAQLAALAGNPAAARAAGHACATNPIALVLPCHRVVGSDGSLHGFGGGLDMKAYLLRLEGAPIGAERKQPVLA